MTRNNGKVEEVDLDSLVSQKAEADKRAFIDGYNKLMEATGLHIMPDARLQVIAPNVFKLETSLLIVEVRSGRVLDTLVLRNAQPQ